MNYTVSEQQYVLAGLYAELERLQAFILTLSPTQELHGNVTKRIETIKNQISAL